MPLGLTLLFPPSTAIFHHAGEPRIDTLCPGGFFGQNMTPKSRTKSCVPGLFYRTACSRTQLLYRNPSWLYMDDFWTDTGWESEYIRGMICRRWT